MRERERLWRENDNARLFESHGNNDETRETACSQAALLRFVALHCVARYYVALHSRCAHRVAPYCTVLHRIAPCCDVLRCSIALLAFAFAFADARARACVRRRRAYVVDYVKWQKSKTPTFTSPALASVLHWITRARALHSHHVLRYVGITSALCSAPRWGGGSWWYVRVALRRCRILVVTLTLTRARTSRTRNSVRRSSECRYIHPAHWGRILSLRTHIIFVFESKIFGNWLQLSYFCRNESIPYTESKFD